MKKIILSALLLASSLCFADVFKDGEKIVDTFFNKGSFIKVVENKNNIDYTNKSLISSIEIDENDIEIATNGYSFMSGKNNDSTSYNVSKWNIENDEYGNIVITRK